MPRIHFLNVDLDIESRGPLTPLVNALGEHTILLHQGRDRGMHHAAFELRSSHRGPDGIIRGFCTLLERLPETAVAAWRDATTRTFDIGYECGSRPRSFRSIVRAGTIRRVAELDAQIVVTIYPPHEDISDTAAPLTTARPAPLPPGRSGIHSAPAPSGTAGGRRVRS